MMRVDRIVFALCLTSLIAAMLSTHAAEPSRIRLPATQKSSANRATTLTPAQGAYIRRTLTPAQRNQLASMSHTLARSSSYSAIQGPWTQFIQAVSLPYTR